MSENKFRLKKGPPAATSHPCVQWPICVVASFIERTWTNYIPLININRVAAAKLSEAHRDINKMPPAASTTVNGIPATGGAFDPRPTPSRMTCMKPQFRCTRGLYSCYAIVATISTGRAASRSCESRLLDRIDEVTCSLSVAKHFVPADNTFSCASILSFQRNASSVRHSLPVPLAINHTTALRMCLSSF